MNDIKISDYIFKIQSQHGLDIKQRMYSDYSNIFENSIVLLSNFAINTPMNPKDKAVYSKHSKTCKQKIADMQKTFIDGLINLAEEQLHLFCFFIIREILCAIDELYTKLDALFSFQALSAHYYKTVFLPVDTFLCNVFPYSNYFNLDRRYPKASA